MHDSIHFFGTTGNKELIFSNILRAGGFYLCLCGQKMIMDPGPGTLQAFVEQYPGKISSLDAVLLSHIHFDHSDEINIFIEGMTSEGAQRRGKVFAPQQAITEHTILPYVCELLPDLQIVTAHSEYPLGELAVRVSTSHRHGVENYGYSFLHKGKPIVTILTDTAYFDGLAESYPVGGTLVVNVPYYCAPPNKRMKHLTALDIPRIAEHIHPHKIILTHFGSNIYEYGIEKCAAELQSATGIEVAAASAGKRFYL